MRYLVVLDGRSTIGATYLGGSNDGTVKVAGERHPALDCPEIDPTNFHYLIVTRQAKGSGDAQKLYIPHSFVAYIACYADNGPKPFGFIPA